jgi:hypothetical protein
MSPEPRRHHYVPEFYLRGFCTAASPGQVVIYDKETGRVSGSSVKKAAVKRDYYRLPIVPNGPSPTALEDALSEVEGRAGKILPNLVNGNVLTTNDRVNWAEFMALSHLRGPAARHMMAEIIVAQMNKEMEATLSTKERYESIVRDSRETDDPISDKVPYDKLLKFWKDREFTLDISEGVTLTSLDAIEKVTGIFHEMNWACVRCPPGSMFITSDTPVSFSSPRGSYDPAVGDGGLMNKEVQVRMPLTKRCMLVAGWRILPPNIQIPTAKVSEINRKTMSHAFRYAYSPFTDDELSRWAKETKGHRRKLMQTNLPPFSLKRNLTRD